MRTVAVIPSRFKSSRFEGKPLADIGGKPMVWWVYNAVCEAKGIDETIVATEDNRVKSVCEKLGIPVIMTSDEHKTPNDRICEVSKRISADVYVVILGDEPLVTKREVEAVIPKQIEDFYVTNLVAEIKNPVEVIDCTNNKIVTNDDNVITFASRAPIPFPKGSLDIKYRKILGISAMSKESLEFYERTPRSKVELAEEIDLLRWVQNGKKVVAIDVETDMISVDTPKDLEEVKRRMAERGDI